MNADDIALVRRCLKVPGSGVDNYTALTLLAEAARDVLNDYKVLEQALQVPLSPPESTLAAMLAQEA